MLIKSTIVNTSHFGCVWSIPPDLMKTFFLNESDQVTLKFGSAVSCATVTGMNSLESDNITKMGLSSNITKDLMIPDGIIIKIKPEGNNQFRFGPVIGILTYQKIIDNMKLNYYKKMALINKENGLLCVFSGSSINESRQTVKGYFFDYLSEKWVLGEFPFPDAVIDRCYPNNYSYHTAIEKVIGSKIFNKKTRIDKTNFFYTVSKDPILRKHLPDTKLFNDMSDLEEFLTKYSEVYLKPIDSFKGKGIVLVKKLSGGKLECKYLTEKKTYTTLLIQSDGIFMLLETAGGKQRTYLVQQAVEAMSYHSAVFSIRVWAMKNDHGYWVVPGMDARGENGFLTNIAAGAKPLPLKKLFKKISQYTALTKDQILILLEETTVRVAEILDTDHGPLGILGLDLMFDKSGQLWLLEANGNPGKSIVMKQKDYFSWPTKTAQYPLAYATYLAGFNNDNILDTIKDQRDNPDIFNEFASPDCVIKKHFPGMILTKTNTSQVLNEMDSPVSSSDQVVIKAAVVVAEASNQKVGSLEIDGPPGVQIDFPTGELSCRINLEITGPPVAKTEILTDKIINDGYVPARLVIESVVTRNPEKHPEENKEFFIPFHSIFEIPGINKGDDIQENITVESATVIGIPCDKNEKINNDFKLILRIVLKSDILVTRQHILSVPAHFVK